MVTGYAGGGLKMWTFADGMLKEKTPLRDDGNQMRVVTFLPGSGQLFSAGKMATWSNGMPKRERAANGLLASRLAAWCLRLTSRTWRSG